MPDIIQRLRELRQSSQSSVVIGIEDEPSKDRPSVAHPIEDWLVNVIIDQLTTPATSRLSLIVLSGNAGDGKSYLLRQIRQRLHEEEGLDPGMIKWLLDATESNHQTQRSTDRLDQFFEPFSDTAGWCPSELHVAAMNTGTVVRFIAHDADKKEKRIFHTLCDVLNLQLAITGSPEEDNNPKYWVRFDHVLVVDLDRRLLFPLAEYQESFLDRMLGALDQRQAHNFLSSASTDCQSCPFVLHCPVNVNLIALQHPIVRQRLNTLFQDITLEDRIHISPRSLWHLIYQMTIGGLDAAALEAHRPLPRCSDMGGVEGRMRARSLFFSAMFDDRQESAEQGASALFAELLRIDPARRFTLESYESALSAGLSSREDLRLCNPIGEQLGVTPEVLCGDPKDSTRRAAAAVRRAFFLAPDEPDPIRHGWLKDWSNNLASHREVILDTLQTRHDSVELLVAVLKEIYGSQHHQGLWYLRLPWRNQTELYAPLSLRSGKKSVVPNARVLGPDLGRPGGLRPVTRELSERLDAYPLAITVPLRDGPDVRVTWPLFRLLQRVQEQRYVAASLNPERVQNLNRIGASLGAQAAITRGVAVITGDEVLLCEEDGAGGFDVGNF
jgi:hypothetical protein